MSEQFYCPNCKKQVEYKKEQNGKRCLECGTYFGESFTLKENPVLQDLLKRLKK